MRDVQIVRSPHNPAAVGKHVVIYEPGQPPLERSRDRLAASLDRAVARSKLSRRDADALIDRAIYTSRFEDLAGTDAVIEAISEDASANGGLFGELDKARPA